MRTSHLGPLVVLALMAAGGPVAAREPAPAVTPLPLEQALQEALEQSPEIVAARQRVAGSQAGLRGARAPANPIFMVAPAIGFGDEAAILSQDVDLVGRRRIRGRVAQGELGAAQAELRLSLLNVATEVRGAYFDLVRALRVEDSAREGLRLARAIRQSVERQVELGLAPRAQLVRADLELARVEQEVTRAQGETAARRVALNTLLGRNPQAPILPSGQLEYPPLPESFETLAAQATESRPEVQAAVATLAARRAQVNLARAERRPVVTAELPFGRWSITDVISRPPQPSDLGIQAHVSFPLFDRGSLRAGVDRARAQAGEQQALAAAARRASGSQIRQAAALFTSAAQVAESYRTALLPRAEEGLRISRLGYEQGFTSFVELLEAQRAYRQTQLEYLSALSDAVRARAAVDRAVGIVPGILDSSPSGEGATPGAEAPAPPTTERKRQ